LPKTAGIGTNNHGDDGNLGISGNRELIFPMTQVVIDIAGWMGAAVLLVAYGLVSFEKMRAEKLLYQSLNAAGSFLLIVNTVYYRAYPSAFVNVVWIVIAFLASMRTRNRQSRAADS
jgi:hypothetical protein